MQRARRMEEEQPAPEVAAAENSPKAAEAPEDKAAGESNPDKDKPEQAKKDDAEPAKEEKDPKDSGENNSAPEVKQEEEVNKYALDPALDLNDLVIGLSAKQGDGNSDESVENNPDRSKKSQ